MRRQQVTQDFAARVAGAQSALQRPPGRGKLLHRLQRAQLRNAVAVLEGKPELAKPDLPAALVAARSALPPGQPPPKSPRMSMRDRGAKPTVVFIGDVTMGPMMRAGAHLTGCAPPLPPTTAVPQRDLLGELEAVAVRHGYHRPGYTTNPPQRNPALSANARFDALPAPTRAALDVLAIRLFAALPHPFARRGAAACPTGFLAALQLFGEHRDRAFLVCGRHLHVRVFSPSRATGCTSPATWLRSRLWSRRLWSRSPRRRPQRSRHVAGRGVWLPDKDQF